MLTQQQLGALYDSVDTAYPELTVLNSAAVEDVVLHGVRRHGLSVGGKEQGLELAVGVVIDGRTTVSIPVIDVLKLALSRYPSLVSQAQDELRTL